MQPLPIFAAEWRRRMTAGSVASLAASPNRSNWGRRMRCGGLGLGFFMVRPFCLLSPHCWLRPLAAKSATTIGIGAALHQRLSSATDRIAGAPAAYAMSWMRGAEGPSRCPKRLANSWNSALRNGLSRPANIVTPAPRRPALCGHLSLGALQPFRARRASNMPSGGELVAVGPMTGVDAFQTPAHDAARHAAAVAGVRARSSPTRFIRPSRLRPRGRSISATGR